MSFSAEEYRKYNTRITKFMKIYSKFISQDLYSSIQLKFEYDQTKRKFVLIDGGKKIDVLIYLYKLFVSIMNSKIDEDTIKELFKIFDEIIEEYLASCHETINEGNKIYSLLCDSSYSIQYEPIKNLLNNKFLINMFVMFNDSLNEISEKINKDDAITKHLQELEKIEFKDNKFYIVQSLYEFHNAISHLYIALKSSIDDRKNIDKAASHLHRGILDSFKNCIQLSNLTDSQKNELIELRVKEFNSIGVSTLDNDKKNILVNYMYLLN
ncbi:hypothetical protein ACOTWV_08825 [Aliarcobacter butzleri]|uniref:hypothetical protein n=1 Tax=Aliarcobacter butzleri TaxID=28197 RepID=UPI003AF5082E